MPMINNVISTTPDYLQGYVGGYPVNVPVGMLVPPVVPRNVVIGNQVVTYNPTTATFMAAGGAVAFGSGGGASTAIDGGTPSSVYGGTTSINGGTP